MRKIIVTIKREGERKGRDLELPNDAPLGQLLPEIIEMLGWPKAQGKAYRLRVQEATRDLSPHETLQAAGVETGDILVGVQRPSLPPSEPRDDKSGIPEPGVGEKEPGAFLISESGVSYPIKKHTAEIGRRDVEKGIYPDVDLLDEDPHRYVHRRHAQLVCKDGQWFLMRRVGVRDGRTFVNEIAVQSGEKSPLHDGDVIRISQVVLTFHTS